MQCQFSLVPRPNFYNGNAKGEKIREEGLGTRQGYTNSETSFLYSKSLTVLLLLYFLPLRDNLSRAKGKRTKLYTWILHHSGTWWYGYLYG